MRRLTEQATIALEKLARRALRSLPIDLDDPSLEDRIRLLEQRLRAVEMKAMVKPVPKHRAPTPQERALLCLWSGLSSAGIDFVDNQRPFCRVEVQKAAAVDRAFRAAGGTYDELGNPMRPA